MKLIFDLISYKLNLFKSHLFKKISSLGSMVVDWYKFLYWQKLLVSDSYPQNINQYPAKPNLNNFIHQ
jgi:hypothetical protein